MKEDRKLPAPRPPIVVVLGHVDHGKTTLLDTIRKTNVAQKEAGGITQSIGASQVLTKDGKTITFIDTPGHAAFASMRARGTKLSDIAILVVASEDGVKPQTKEALEYILGIGIPFIVAITKIDLPSANPDNVRQQLEKEGVIFEGRGGDTPLVKVSAKKGVGINELLEIIGLMSELHAISGDSNAPLDSFVIETGKGKSGPYASIVLKNGTLKTGDEVVSETSTGKIRGIFDFQGKILNEVKPGQPAQILGFSEPPPIGSKIWHKDGHSLPTQFKKGAIEEKVSEGKIPILIKAKNAGSLEAVLAHVPTNFFVVFSDVGDVSESDVLLAKSAGAEIITFESKSHSGVLKLAKTEGVKIESFTIIYELFEKLDNDIKKGEVQILGKAQILNIFPFDDKKVAGCKVVNGKITKNDLLILSRNERDLGKIKILSMKKGRQEISDAGPGEEFGILFTPQLEFKVGDVILSVRK